MRRSALAPAPPIAWATQRVPAVRSHVVHFVQRFRDAPDLIDHDAVGGLLGDEGAQMRRVGRERQIAVRAQKVDEQRMRTLCVSHVVLPVPRGTNRKELLRCCRGIWSSRLNVDALAHRSAPSASASSALLKAQTEKTPRVFSLWLRKRRPLRTHRGVRGAGHRRGDYSIPSFLIR